MPERKRGTTSLLLLCLAGLTCSHSKDKINLLALLTMAPACTNQSAVRYQNTGSASITLALFASSDCTGQTFISSTIGAAQTGGYACVYPGRYYAKSSSICSQGLFFATNKNNTVQFDGTVFVQTVDN